MRLRICAARSADGSQCVRWREGADFKRHAPAPPFQTKTEAREWFAEHVRPRLNGGLSAADRRMSLRAFANRYLNLLAATHEPRTTSTLRYRLEKYALPVFGDVPLVELERMPLAIVEWREKLPRRSAYGIVQALRQVLNAAVSYELIRVDAAANASPNPQPRPEELQPFTLTEIDKLDVELADDDGTGYGPLVVFAAETGLMPSEWIALERRDVQGAGRRRARRALIRGRTGEGLRQDGGQAPSGTALGASDRRA